MVIDCHMVITLILDRLKPIEPWLARNVINKAFINNWKQRATTKVVIVSTKSTQNGIDNTVLDSEISEFSNVSSFGGGSNNK